MQRVGDREPMDGELGRFYDAIENPRKTRNELPILRGDDLRSYMEGVRERTLEVLDSVELHDTDDPLLREGFIYEMLLAHEHQHNETMLQLLQMVDGYAPVRVDGTVAGEPVADGPEMVLVEAGTHAIGAGPEGFAYDNERPAHEVELDAFEIDRAPVTNGCLRRVRRRHGRRAAHVLGARRRRLGHDDLRAPPVARPRPPGGPRRLAPGRRLRPLGRQAPADRARVGGGRRRRRPATAPTSITSASAAPRRARTRTGPRTAAPCRCSATSGSGPRRTSPPTPVSRPSRTPSTPRSSSATPTRCCAAARGRRGGP